MLSIFRQRFLKHSFQGLVHLKNTLGVESKRKHYYFGYGANLSLSRFTDRGMNVKEVGNACLKDHKISFTLANEYLKKGYAGVDLSSGDEVWGVLYEIDSISLILLDIMEWCGFGTYSREVKNVLVDGKEHEAFCYVVKNPVNGLYPSDMYLSYIIKSSKEREFPSSYIQFLEQFKSYESFELDHSFSLLFYGKKRMGYPALKSIYKVHDRLREKLCDFI